MVLFSCHTVSRISPYKNQGEIYLILIFFNRKLKHYIQIQQILKFFKIKCKNHAKIEIENVKINRKCKNHTKIGLFCYFSIENLKINWKYQFFSEKSKNGNIANFIIFFKNLNNGYIKIIQKYWVLFNSN